MHSPTRCKTHIYIHTHTVAAQAAGEFSIGFLGEAEERTATRAAGAQPNQIGCMTCGRGVSMSLGSGWLVGLP